MSRVVARLSTYLKQYEFPKLYFFQILAYCVLYLAIKYAIRANGFATIMANNFELCATFVCKCKQQ